MVELIGDICRPSDLIVPEKFKVFVGALSGMLIMSGSALKWYNGAAWRTITDS